MDLSSVLKAILVPQQGRAAEDMMRLQPGDQLSGRVIQVENEGIAWIDFGSFRARTQTLLPVLAGQVLQLKVVATGQPLHLQVIWPSPATENLPVAQINPAGVLNQDEQQRFLLLIDRLLGGAAQAQAQDLSQQQSKSLPADSTGLRIGSEALQQALTHLKSIFEPLALDLPIDQIAARVRTAIQEYNCFFEKKLAEVIVALPEGAENEKVAMLLNRHIKPQLALLKTALGDGDGRPGAAAGLPEKDLQFFRKSVDRLLNHFEQQQDRIVQRHGTGDPVQVLTHWLPLKDHARPMKLKIHYRKKKPGHEDQRFHHIALLLDMTRIGMVRVDLSLMDRGLRIDFYLQNQTVQKEFADQGHTISETLSTCFETVRVVTHINQEKIARFDQEDLELASSGRVDVQA